MKNDAVYDLVCIGNYTKDTIVSPAGIKHVDGGAVNYAAHAANRLGYKVAVVTRLAKEDQRVAERLGQAGIDCYVTHPSQSTCMKLVYPTNDPDIRTLFVASTAGAITPREVDPVQAKAAVIGTSLRGEVGLDVIRALQKKNLLLAADVQGFVRVLRDQTLVYEPWDEMRAVLACLDILKTDAVEAEYLTGQTDIYRAVQAFAAMGPREVVLTHKDGLLVYEGGQFYEAGFFSRSLEGRSGRGDTCIGTYVAMRLARSPAEALIWAAAVTSLKMENLGPFNRSISEVEELIRTKYRNGSFRSQTAAN
jgi:sugar/nucleoside kinase (ribokinase family)